MEPSLTIDDMINNPDLLLSAVNETFASDTSQQYYTPQTPSAYMPQPVQQMLQKQQSKTQVIEVLLKELNELRSRVKNLEELSQQRAQQQPLEMPSIQIPIRLDITTNDQDTSQNIGVGKATKKIRITKRKIYAKNHLDNQQTALFRATTSLERIPLNLLNNIH